MKMMVDEMRSFMEEREEGEIYGQGECCRKLLCE